MYLRYESYSVYLNFNSMGTMKYKSIYLNSDYKLLSVSILVVDVDTIKSLNIDVPLNKDSRNPHFSFIWFIAI